LSQLLSDYGSGYTAFASPINCHHFAESDLLTGASAARWLLPPKFEQSF
jgi:hypothetical protein